MIIISINIRGLGGRLKKKEIRDLVRVYKPDFICIQETKMDCVNSKLCHSLWGGEEIDWAFVPAEGASGGILSIWNKKNFVSEEIRHGNNFVTVRGKWSSHSIFSNIMNVYCPCDLARKRLFWDEAKSDREIYSGDMWCVVGDFNTVLHQEEKMGVGSHFDRRVSSEFAHFVEDMDLLDLPLAGSKFTWFVSNGSAMSRLDRFLVDDSWLSSWGRLVQMGLKRVFSDHCPILLKNEIHDWGPSPFRTNNCWFSEGGFINFVASEWSKMMVSGRGSFVFKEKLKLLKKSLKIWNAEHFGMLDKKIADQVSIINFVDGKGGDGTLSSEDIEIRKVALADLWRFSSKKDNLLRQKARQRWLRDGDSNSKFFHAWINRRRRSSEILGLTIDGEWVDDPSRVKDHIRLFFEARFSEAHWNRPSLNGILFNQISAEDNQLLVARFEEKEIKDAVWSCEGDKSPGPDGFNFTFIKKSWEVVKDDIFAMVDDFYVSGNLTRGCNSSFIVLIPKTGCPSELGNYRPISLVGCIHKIISKFLAGRLKLVLHSVISENQTALLKGRYIMDGVVIGNEIIDRARKNNGHGCFIFKVDFEKAYDSVNWSFLLYMMERMGFCFKWRNWIKSCLQSSCVSVLVNGSPTLEFNLAKGLRQGDPIAPFLFLIVAEGLAGIMRSAVAKNLFSGYLVGKDKVMVSHLHYADDTLLIGENSDKNIETLKCILHCFELSSGLKINFSKSSFISVKSEEGFVQSAVHKLFCAVGSVPFKFLGIHVGANPKRLATWSPIIHSFKKKLSFWQQKLISFGGRVTLLNSVLSSLPIYFFSFFKAPVSVIKELVKIQRRFLWGKGEGSKGVSWVRWELVCRTKEGGGLGVKNLSLFNLALLGKWRWRALFEREALWVHVLRSKYGEEVGVVGGSRGVNYFKKGSRWWRDLGLLNCREHERNLSDWFVDGVRRKLGSGESVSFWSDIWVGDVCLSSQFFRLFQLALDKEASVSSSRHWRNGVWQWSIQWRRSLFDWEQAEVDDLNSILESVRGPSNSMDGWIWKNEKDGVYSVRNAYHLLLNEVANIDSSFYKRLWRCNVPSEIKCLVWKMSLDGVPTLSNLKRRGVVRSPSSSNCQLRGLEEESVDHLFFHCSFSYGVWQGIYSWFGMSSVLHSDVKSNFYGHEALLRLGKNRRRQWMCIWFVTLWSIWLNRNKVIFEKKSSSLEEIMFSIQLHSWNLISVRFSSFSYSFLDWVWNPAACFSCID
ncbi:unnamed protein product [Lupinus luteus]|uniref:Reverse transcriptase domain-containing protein n=1 Tax=Lupinus luteus TaxID=3873 RepID=A0AAV1YID9_LUPLU